VELVNIIFSTQKVHQSHFLSEMLIGLIGRVHSKASDPVGIAKDWLTEARRSHLYCHPEGIEQPKDKI
jgi:hypothetical protein